MVSKKRRLRGKVCVYCAKHPAETEDHVFSRRVFQTTPDENVIKVPACDRCNNYKSKLEEYAGTILLFGSEHPEAGSRLSEIGARRLAGNRKLAKKIGASMQRGYRRDSKTGFFHEAMMVSIESGKIAELFGMLARALYYRETGHTLPSGFVVEPRWVIKGQSEQVMRDLIGSRGHRVSVRLESGLCDCEGLISDETAGVSAWVFSPYGGVLLGSDSHTRGDSRLIGVLIGPAEAFEEANRRKTVKAPVQSRPMRIP